MRRLVIRHLVWSAAQLIGVTLFATSAAAYRTAGESPEFEGTGRVRWSRDQVSFVINTEGEPSGVGGGVSDVVLDAMRQWNEPLCSSLELQPAGVTNNPAMPADGVNTIAWVRDWQERGFSADAPATTDVQYEREVTTNADGEEEAGEWRIVEADVYLDARRSWTLLPVANSAEGANDDPNEASASLETFDLYSVLTHEFGHAAGLMHPCEVGGEGGAPNCRGTSTHDEVTMYPLYSPDQATLELDDERGLCFLYEQDTCEQTGCEPGFKCIDQRCEALCGSGTSAEVCSLGETCADGKCIEECTSFECLNPTCKRNKDCPATLRCDGKYCVPGLGELGDPCATPRDCASQACSKNGVCLASCAENTDCESKKCRSGLNGSRVCATSLNALGEECDESNECLGAQCVADAVETPVCTRRCGEGESDCPLDWSCDLVEGRAVCVPPPPAEKGCAVAPHDRSDSGSGAAAILFTLAAASGLRRRNRHRGESMLTQYIASRLPIVTLFVSATTLAVACSKNDAEPDVATQTEEPSPPNCEQGDTRECVGPGACSGGQACGSDETWGACECGNADQGTSAVASDGSAGSAPVGTQTDQTSPDGHSQGAVPPNAVDAAGVISPDEAEASTLPETEDTFPDAATPEPTSSRSNDQSDPASTIATDGSVLPGSESEQGLDAGRDSQLGSEYVATPPLVVEPWPDPDYLSSAPTVREDIGLLFAIAARRAVGLSHSWEAGDPLSHPYEEPGKYCVFGDAVAFNTYDVMPGLTLSFGDSTGTLVDSNFLPWRPKNYGVVALEFHVSGAPPAGIALVVDGASEPGMFILLDGTNTLVIDAAVEPSENVSTWPVDDALTTLRFTVHVNDVEEPTPYDFCISNLQFVLKNF